MESKGISGRILYYEDGEVIFEENSASTDMYIIETGKVEISQRVNNRKTIMAVLGKGDFLGEMAMLTDAPRAMTAASVGRTTLMAFCMEEMLHNLQSDLQFAVNLLQALANRLRNANSLLGSLIAKVYEFGDGFMEGVIPEVRPLKIGEILMEMGSLTKPQLDRTLQKQKEIHLLEHRHKLLGEIMVESGLITQEQLRDALAEQRMRFRYQFS
jgi:CRP-like cAMP-binding protein